MPRRVRSAQCRLAFTLVELLAVIGIISVLLALLLPAFAKARKQTYRLACMSNLRQLGQALLAYAQNNKGAFPAAAFGGAVYPEDWLHWQPGRDVRTNGIMPFLGGSLDVLRCPMGVPERAPVVAVGGPSTPVPPYAYSYSVDGMFTGYSTGFYFNPKSTGEPFARLGRIINPSEKAMMIEEDVNGINDGMWRPESRDYLSWRYSSVSMRHDTEREGHPEGAYFNVAGNGNVVFADAHLEPYPRWKLERSKYTDPNHRGN